ncbi:cyclic nucleotide-binding domain-containing protein [Desulfocurvus sp.]|jgi:CRP-like cAMP-binding protein|uniref:Crp/Fnr family transcriptional regulator n=1 Tax=Desulfocurvus sp. TaxID=2871698 RepID=UPI0025C64AB6|nr:cyclic nucleotide-binding domain-containing protein [Desulfocurvus sp.]
MGLHRNAFLVKNFLKYSVIFGEGSRGDTAYLLQEGRVEISKMVEGRKKVLAILSPVSMFGEMAILLGDERRTATAVALEESKVVEIQRHAFEDYIRQSPPMINSLVTVLVHRLKTATVRSLHVPNLFLGVCQTLALMARHGATDLNYLDTLASLTAAFNVAKESVEAVLSTLAEDGIVAFEVDAQRERRIVIRQTEALVATAAARRKAAQE